MKIAIVGLGYVGLPLSLQFARSGVTVLGLDIDAAKVDALNQGRVTSNTSPRVRGRGDQGRAPSRPPRISAASGKWTPSSFACRRRSTRTASRTFPTSSTPARGSPGICKRGRWSCSNPRRIPAPRTKICARCWRWVRAFRRADFHLAFSPEREDPGNPDSKVAIIPKVVGGYTPACLERARALYSMAIKTIVPVSSCRAAEATKLLENIFRSVNIALVNELKVVYGAMGIDVWEVINAAKTKPFGFMPFYPGPGLGGHCIPIDPFYLTWKAREFGQNTRFIELAGEVNTAMPDVRGEPDGRGAQRATQGGERQPRVGAGPGLQSQTWTTSANRRATS